MSIALSGDASESKKKSCFESRPAIPVAPPPRETVRRVVRDAAFLSLAVAPTAPTDENDGFFGLKTPPSSG
jgi:hypothetical protein